jgi:tetraacyldisaccharide 4'-kinase
MNESRESRFRQIMDGSDRTASAQLLRTAAAIAEPFYSLAMQWRNHFYDRGILPSHPLGRPTVSVGNLTTGGTGKTPIVQWLTRRFVAERQHPAVLMRGYKSNSDIGSDEGKLLATGQIPVIADPDRLRGAASALQKYPRTTVFVLDDAMQHRRARRDFELVLLHAAHPYGYGHVFPRGLLRESIYGLGRADAVLLTHSSESNEQGLQDTITGVRERHPQTPVFQCDHVIQAFHPAEGPPIPIEQLSGHRYFAFCGIGSPQGFFDGLSKHGGICAGTREFDDHHDYTEADIVSLMTEAKTAAAEMVITTQKDWVKVGRFAEKFSIPLFWAGLSIRFHADHEEKLWQLMTAKLPRAEAQRR